MTNEKNQIFLEVPLRLFSEANVSQHWSKKYKRKKFHQNCVTLSLNSFERPSLPCCVILTRVAPRFLDDQDNLGMAMKHVIDAVASWIIPGLAPGRADGDPRINWKIKQEKGKPKEYGLKIEIS
jgi:hypothetical protein